MSSKINNMQSFGHKCLFRHNLNHDSNQKRIFTKSCQFGSLTKKISSEHNNVSVCIGVLINTSTCKQK
jgi:hypothetical protein